MEKKNKIVLSVVGISLIIIYILLQFLDLITTYVGLSLGVIDLNPLINYSNWVFFKLILIISTTAFFILLYNKTKITRYAIGGVSLIYLFGVINNIRVIGGDLV